MYDFFSLLEYLVAFERKLLLRNFVAVGSSLDMPSWKELVDP